MFVSGFLLFPEVTQLDFTGPYEVLARVPSGVTHLIASTLDPVPTQHGLAICPTSTFDSAPPLDLLCVPGGPGIPPAMMDRAIVSYVRQAAVNARLVTSVCTGALLLGAAGLLKGKRATTHWAYVHLLSVFGAAYQHARVVRDGELMTGAGVSAGIDLSLAAVAEMFGGDVAQEIQLSIEYDPSPPYRGGAPDRTPENILQAVTPVFAKNVERARIACEASVNRPLPPK